MVPLGNKYLIKQWRIFCSDSFVRLESNGELIVSDLKGHFLSMRTDLAVGIGAQHVLSSGRAMEQLIRASPGYQGGMFIKRI